jgi:hypothetical protein
MKMASKVTAEQREQMKSFLKPKAAAKPMHPKERIGEKTNRVLPIRGIKL